MTALATGPWCTTALVPLSIGVLLRWPHQVVPAWRRPGRRRARVGGVLVAAGLWISPLWQVPVGAWAAERDLARFTALAGASRDEVLARTGIDLARSPADDGLPIIVRDVWAGRWYAPLSLRFVELVSLEGDRLLLARPD